MNRTRVPLAPIESGGGPPHSKTLTRWPQSRALPPGFGVRRPCGALDCPDRFMVPMHGRTAERALHEPGANQPSSGPREKNWRSRPVAALVPRLVFAAFLLLQFASVAQVSNIYSTGFELSEGFDLRYTLMGQGGWTGTDTNGNGNGIVRDYFAN